MKTEAWPLLSAMLSQKKPKSMNKCPLCVSKPLGEYEEELWIEWTHLVDFLDLGYQMMLLSCDFVDVLFLFCCSMLILTTLEGNGVEDLRKWWKCTVLL